MSFLIRRSPDILLICSSPRLIAACHVLLRLLMPRHSPYALCSLNFLVLLILLCLKIAISFCLVVFSWKDLFTTQVLNCISFTTFVWKDQILSLLLLSICSFSIPFSKINRKPFRICLVGLDGLEPSTSRLSGARSNHLSYRPLSPTAVYSFISIFGGDDGIRTHDPLLAGQVLSQLSYTPV